ncbi:hypothetical protein L7F22_068076 [Adiantum nelumboides]|jgi:ER lumen protein retaining receptor|nr:hypothetical protein [Adiantum nelumboides]
MNIFRLFGDLSHLASIFILLQKIQVSKSCRGISFKTQLLYSIVFVTRYLDIFADAHRSLYRFLMKCFFIGSSIYVLYLMRVKYRPTHDPAIDTIRLEYLLGPAALLALIFHYREAGAGFFSTLQEIFWAFSIYLESVAILPQLFMLQRTGEAETITTHYLFALGAYRALYIPNWIYRYFAEGSIDPISILAGLVQTGLYLDFFYIYFTKVMKGEKFELPA